MIWLFAMEILQQNLDYVHSSKLKSFVRVHSKHSLYRGQVRYVNMPENKLCLVEHCVELQSERYSIRIIPTILETDSDVEGMV